MLFTCFTSSIMAVLGSLCLTGRLGGVNSFNGFQLASLGHLAAVGGLAVVSLALCTGVSLRFIPVNINDSPLTTSSKLSLVKNNCYPAKLGCFSIASEIYSGKFTLSLAPPALYVFAVQRTVYM